MNRIEKPRCTLLANYFYYFMPEKLRRGDMNTKPNLKSGRLKMNKKIEEVKKILQSWLGDSNLDKIAEKICQLRDAEWQEILDGAIHSIIKLDEQLCEHKLETKDTECQARVERIFKEIEDVITLPAIDRQFRLEEWRALKKREGVKGES